MSEKNFGLQPALVGGWSNKNNHDFYHALGVSALEARAQECGLGSNPDLELLRPFLANHPRRGQGLRIVEIGGGFGRVVDWLNKKVSNAQIEVIEPVTDFSQHLQQRFGDSKRISIAPQSILQLDLKPADVFLWMWAGFLDFRAIEKEQALLKISQALPVDGFLAIELPQYVDAAVRTESNGDLELVVNGSRWYGNVLPEAELNALFSRCGLRREETIYYQSEASLLRRILILRGASYIR